MNNPLVFDNDGCPVGEVLGWEDGLPVTRLWADEAIDLGPADPADGWDEDEEDGAADGDGPKPTYYEPGPAWEDVALWSGRERPPSEIGDAPCAPDEITA